MRSFRFSPVSCGNGGDDVAVVRRVTPRSDAMIAFSIAPIVDLSYG